MLGPLIVNAIADAGKKAGHVGPDLYATSFYIMIALLVVGFVANELIRPVDPKFHEPKAVDETEKPSPSKDDDEATVAKWNEAEAADAAETRCRQGRVGRRGEEVNPRKPSSTCCSSVRGCGWACRSPTACTGSS